MKKSLIVFDFDKTLTVDDTIFGFYKFVSEDSIMFFLKRVPFLIAAVLAKLAVISNDRLKQWGVFLFLKGFSEEELNKKGIAYTSKIEMSSVFEKEFRKYPVNQVIILSASYEEYLKPMFPEYLVAGTRISYNENDMASGVSRNLYGIEKRKWLSSREIEEISVLYTDSYSDKPLMDIAEYVYLVKGNLVTKIKGGEL